MNPLMAGIASGIAGQHIYEEWLMPDDEIIPRTIGRRDPIAPRDEGRGVEAGGRVIGRREPTGPRGPFVVFTDPGVVSGPRTIGGRSPLAPRGGGRTVSDQPPDSSAVILPPWAQGPITAPIAPPPGSQSAPTDGQSAAAAPFGTDPFGILSDLFLRTFGPEDASEKPGETVVVGDAGYAGGGSSNVLIIVLLLAAAGAGYYFFIYKKGSM